MSTIINLINETHSQIPFLFQDIEDFLRDKPDGQVFYIVPDNIKFASEKNLLQAFEGRDAYSALLSVGVYSFSRLLWYLESQVFLSRGRALSDTGSFMLLEKVLKDLEGQLSVFRSDSRHIGFIEQLDDLRRELEKGNIRAGQLRALIDTLEKEGQSDSYFLRKLKELYTIYDNLEAICEKEGYQPAYLHTRLREILDYYDLGSTMLIFDRFNRFNAEELATVKVLCAKAKQVQFVVNFWPEAKDNEPYMDIFYQTRQLFSQITVEIAPDAKVRRGQVDTSIAPFFIDMESDFFKHQFETHDTKYIKDGPITLWQCESEYLEAENVANEIYRLVNLVNAKYRYRDFQITLRDFDAYEAHLLPILRRNKIPYFIEFAERMSQHPLSRLLTALYRIDRYHWRYQDIFNLLRTELCLPEAYKDENKSTEENMRAFRELLDSVENIVLQNGYEGPKAWSLGNYWHYLPLNENGEFIATEEDRYLQEQANVFKHTFVSALEPLFKSWHKEVSTREALDTLYQTLVFLGVPEQLLTWCDTCTQKGDLPQAKRHEQAWGTFIDLLEEYESLFSDEKFDVKTFFDILLLTFQKASYTLVPPTLDSVRICDYQKLQVDKRRISFVMGLKRSTLPKTYQEASLLSTSERGALGKVLIKNQRLLEPTLDKTYQERNVAYQILFSAKERLYLSYSYNVLGEKICEPSPYWSRIRAYYNIDPEIIKASDIYCQNKIIRLGNWRGQLLQVMRALRQAKMRKQDEIDLYTLTIWRERLNHLLEEDISHSLTERVQDALNYQNTVGRLKAKTAAQLYGLPIEASVSRFETYNANPFVYFLKYGLKLQEREVFDLTPIRTGNYFHSAMEQIIKQWLQVRNMDKAYEETMKLLDDEKLYPEFKIFKANPHYQFLAKHLKKDVYHLARQVCQHLESLKPDQILLEQAFGFKGSLPPYRLLLDDGQEIVLRGKIDRVDIWQDLGLFEIIDYKSSPQAYDFGRLYMGLDLQLLTYLNVMQAYFKSKDKDYQAIGAFHQLISPNFIVLSDSKDLELLVDEEKYHDKQAEQFILRGYIHSLNQGIKRVERDVGAGEKSHIYNYELTKNGEISKKRGKDQPYGAAFNNLLTFIDDKLKQTALAMLSGDISLMPYEELPYDESLRMPWLAISRFDRVDGGNRYRQLPSIRSLEEFLKLIEGGDGLE